LNEGIDFISALGLFWPELDLKRLLASLAIMDEPPPLRDSHSCFASNPGLGVELTFKNSALLKVRFRDYPKRARVLHNIRFYGRTTSEFSPYRGTLPLGLQFGMSRQSLMDLLGPPSWFSDDIGSMRWDAERYCLFADLSKGNEVKRISVQTPVVESTRRSVLISSATIASQRSTS
jgi:hypothetical protein